MQKTIPTIFLAFAVLFATAGTSLGQEVTMDDLVEREGLMYRPFTTVPFTGVTTGLKQYTFKNGKRDGPFAQYHDNGQLRGKGNYTEGYLDGPWVWYYANGELDTKGNWINGKRDGPWVWYFIDGRLSWIGNYKDGKREGPWVEFRAFGELTGKGNYTDGKRDGPWVWVNQDGVLNKEESGTYKDGVKVSD